MKRLLKGIVVLLLIIGLLTLFIPHLHSEESPQHSHSEEYKKGVSSDYNHAEEHDNEEKKEHLYEIE